MKKTLISVFLLSACAAFAQGEYKSHIDRILSGNNALIAQKAAMEAELQSQKAENMLSGPELEGGLMFPQESGESRRWEAGISQSFDWPGLYASRRKSANYKAGAFEQLYKASYLEKASEAKQLLIDYAKALEDLSLILMATENLNSLADVSRIAYDKGQITIIDYKKLQLEIFNLSLQKAEAEATLNDIKLQIEALAGSAQVVPESWQFPDEKLRAENEYLSILESNDPTVAANAQMMLAAASETRTARMSALPGFTLGFNHAFEDGKHFNGFSVGIEIPVWNNKARVAAAKSAEEAQRLESLDYAIRSKASVRSDYALASRLEARIAQAKGLFDNDDYTVLLKKSLDGGAINLYDYLNELNNYILLRKEYISLVHSYQSVAARLNRFDLIEND